MPCVPLDDVDSRIRHLVGRVRAFSLQIEKDSDRFRRFAKFARECGWGNLADEFDGFAKEAEDVLLGVRP